MNSRMRAIVALALLGGAVSAQEAVSLFDGKTLKGWKVVTCEAEVDGAILLKAGNGYLQAEVPNGGQFLFKNITIIELDAK